jgi:hypothetical protein
VIKLFKEFSERFDKKDFKIYTKAETAVAKLKDNFILMQLQCRIIKIPKKMEI